MASVKTLTFAGIKAAKTDKPQGEWLSDNLNGLTLRVLPTRLKIWYVRLWYASQAKDAQDRYILQRRA